MRRKLRPMMLATVLFLTVGNVASAAVAQDSSCITSYISYVASHASQPRAVVDYTLVMITRCDP